jgi:hypothetical protein
VHAADDASKLVTAAFEAEVNACSADRFPNPRAGVPCARTGRGPGRRAEVRTAGRDEGDPGHRRRRGSHPGVDLVEIARCRARQPAAEPGRQRRRTRQRERAGQYAVGVAAAGRRARRIPSPRDAPPAGAGPDCPSARARCRPCGPPPWPRGRYGSTISSVRRLDHRRRPARDRIRRAPLEWAEGGGEAWPGPRPVRPKLPPL